MLNWVLGNKRKGKTASPKKKKATGKKPSYEKSREIASKGSITERQNLAQHEDLEPEILYYFASDSGAEVRREVAENPGTPLQGDLVLARDVDEEVRCELATKIGRLVPQLSPDESERLTDMAVEVLEVLARDELPRVRAIIAEELKHADNVPKSVIERLASDLEEIVSVPVLEYSPLLNASDLVNLVPGGQNFPRPWSMPSSTPRTNVPSRRWSRMRRQKYPIQHLRRSRIMRRNIRRSMNPWYIAICCRKSRSCESRPLSARH